jgi:hypothetical protein
LLEVAVRSTADELYEKIDIDMYVDHQVRKVDRAVAGWKAYWSQISIQGYHALAAQIHLYSDNGYEVKILVSRAGKSARSELIAHTRISK